MKTRKTFLLQSMSVVLLLHLLIFGSAHEIIQGLDRASTTTQGGLRRVTFNTLNGRVIVNLPDDMAAGDTISGTVVAEPKGQTEEERDRNAADLSKLQLRIGSQAPKDPDKDLLIMIKPRIINNFNILIPPSNNPPPLKFTIGQPNAPLTEVESVLITVSGPIWFVNDQAKQATPSQTPSTSSPNNFRLPPIGQQGRPVEIFGPFDGNLSNTILNFQTLKSSVHDFEKNTENVSGGFGLIGFLAESPRKAVFESPMNFTGPAELTLKEANVETKGNYRNVGVRLSAPKTNLLRDERTTLTVEVSGLEGIKQPVPLTLESQGVITMEEGNYQPLMIQPTQVGADGRYSTTRGITGVQTGAWTATATVLTQHFNICLQDDSVPARVVLWNTFTGDYTFTNIRPPPRPGQPRPPGVMVPTGGAMMPGGFNFSGTGQVVRKGCIITLKHNAPDRRVMGTLDKCTNTGNATVQGPSTGTRFTITDRNTTDNTCTCGPGCK